MDVQDHMLYSVRDKYCNICSNIEPWLKTPKRLTYIKQRYKAPILILATIHTICLLLTTLPTAALSLHNTELFVKPDLNIETLTCNHSSSPYSRLVSIKASKLTASVLKIFLGFHTHIEDGAIFATADNLAVHATLAALTLGPQSPEAHLKV